MVREPKTRATNLLRRFVMEVPFGYCHCGCGEKTKIAEANDPRYGTVKGQPFRFIARHHRRSAPFPYEIRACGYLTPCWIWLWNKATNGYASINTRTGTRCARQTHCTRGHEKTAATWQFDGFHMRCILCRRLRRRELAAGIPLNKS